MSRSPNSTTIAAVRGAISVKANRAADIREASARLLEALIARNAVTPERVVSALFTATPDLTADFPAHAARRLGWTDVPLLGAVELAVPGAPKRIVRVLLTLRDVKLGEKLTPVLGQQHQRSPLLHRHAAQRPISLLARPRFHTFAGSGSGRHTRGHEYNRPSAPGPQRALSLAVAQPSIGIRAEAMVQMQCRHLDSQRRRFGQRGVEQGRRIAATAVGDRNTGLLHKALQRSLVSLKRP